MAHGRHQYRAAPYRLRCDWCDVRYATRWDDPAGNRTHACTAHRRQYAPRVHYWRTD